MCLELSLSISRIQDILKIKVESTWGYQTIPNGALNDEGCPREVDFACRN